MDAVTYPTAEVADFTNQNFIPLRVASDSQPLADDFNVKWTPTLIVLSPEGKVQHRTLGFIAPENLIPSLLLGHAKLYFNREQHDEALARLQKLLAEHPGSLFCPEAIYLRGVCLYKSSNDPQGLKEAYEQLKAEYASHMWTERAYPYRLL